ncbi:flagellar hook-basal body complex protein FliE [Limnobacter humi]|uniref:Flagellar hook-basal body complex protein FliE n=1 Tax=Limnobacter humi TaxID=1778671 RepID=A0ABT1WKF3_9BURK|nr:flagellar hook-basal body complex protein FliE [Limnobacter humi]MCQ8897503.1 flagellar hook-basal body complex protein FliE [Limnobacter humi]
MNEMSRLSSASPLQLLGTQSGISPQSASGTPSFTEVFGDVLSSVSKAQDTSRQLSVGLQMNDPKVSVEDVAIASNEAQLKFQTLLQTRNKLLQAYSDIMSMPV